MSNDLTVFPFDIQVLAFNRPEYLENCLVGLQAQTLAIDPKRIFFWQDGYSGSRDEHRGLPDKTEKSLKLIRKHFPDSEVIVSQKNLGIGLSFKDAEENAFVHRGNEWGIFIEEDNVLQDYYLEVILKLINKVKKFDEIVQLDAFGDYKNQTGQDYFIPMHSWAFALRSEHYFERKELLSGYEDILKDDSYFKRDTSRINDYFANYGIRPVASSQDYIKRILMSHYNRIALTTSFSGANNIGAFGEHFNPEVYNQLGYQFQAPAIEVQALPPITQKTILSLVWNQLGYLEAEFNIEKDSLKSERDILVAAHEAACADRDLALAHANAARDAAVEERISAVTAANAARDAAVEERNQLLNSTVWRSTKFIRFVIGKFKNLIR